MSYTVGTYIREKVYVLCKMYMSYTFGIRHIHLAQYIYQMHKTYTKCIRHMYFSKFRNPRIKILSQSKIVVKKLVLRKKTVQFFFVGFLNFEKYICLIPNVYVLYQMYMSYTKCIRHIHLA